MTELSAATASASFKITEKACKGGIFPTLCTELSKESVEVEGTETYTGKLVTGTKVTFTAHLGVEEVRVSCNKDESTGEILQTEPLIHAVISRKGVLHFKECSLLGLLGERCKDPAEITTANLEGTVIEETPIKAGIVEADSGGTIVSIPFENKAGCPATVKGAHAVAGEDLCITSEAEVAKAVHAGECTAEGSKLTFGGSENPAVFESQSEVELSGGSKGVGRDISSTG